MKRVLDTTDDLAAAVRLATNVDTIDALLEDTLDAVGGIIPFDLATIMQLRGDELLVRVARGALDSPAVRQHRLQLAEFPSLREVLERGKARAFVESDHNDGDGDPFDGLLDLPHGHFCMVVPLQAARESLGVMTLDRATCGRYSEKAVRLADIMGRLLAQVMTYGEQSLRLTRIKAQLEEQNRLLQHSVPKPNACQLLEASRSPTMRNVSHMARQVAASSVPVLITGETGTGKEVLAQAIHGWSPRADKPLISLNCAALPANLIESELFGHVKGAFSGATQKRLGRFQAANGGTLFLDEVGELPLDLQAKLLRVLQDGTFEAVGSDRTVRVDVRILAATNRDLLVEASERRFREDLYYRLAVFPIHLPPLRARREDIPVICTQVLDLLGRREGREPFRLEPKDLESLSSRPWPGNVRELVNTLERASVLTTGPVLQLDSGSTVAGSVVGQPRDVAPSAESGPVSTLEEMERQHIGRVLDLTDGRIYGDQGAARILGLNPSTLASRMKKLGLGGAREYRQRTQ